MSGLTAADVFALGGAVLIDERGMAIGFDHSVVERIVQQRVDAALAPIEALADEWEHIGRHDRAAKRAHDKLRAAIRDARGGAS